MGGNDINLHLEQFVYVCRCFSVKPRLLKSSSWFRPPVLKLTQKRTTYVKPPTKSISLTGWWCNNHLEKLWSSSMVGGLSHIWWKIIQMFQTTNQLSIIDHDIDTIITWKPTSVSFTHIYLSLIYHGHIVEYHPFLASISTHLPAISGDDWGMVYYCSTHISVIDILEYNPLSDRPIWAIKHYPYPISLYHI